MWSVKIPTRILATSLCLLLALASPGMAQESLSESLPVGAKARLGQGSVYDTQYSPDGTRLAVGGSAGIWLYDTRTYEIESLLTDYTQPIYSVAFSPNGRTLAGCGPDGTILLWDISTGTLRHTLYGYWPGRVDSIAFSPDGQTLASGGPDRNVHLWDVATGTLQQVLEDPRNPMHGVRSVAFSPDARTLASGSSDGTVRLWDVATGTLQQALESQEGKRVNGVAFSPDARILASSHWDDAVDDAVRLWDVATGTLQHILPSSGFVSLAFSPDGQTLAISGDLWDVDTGTFRYSLETVKVAAGPLRGYGIGVESVAFSPDGQTLASTNQDHTVRLWDAATGTMQRFLPSAGSPLVFSPDGRTLAGGGSPVRLWDVATDTLLHELEHGFSFSFGSVAFSPDSQTLASAEDTVRLWDVVTGTLLHQLKDHGDNVRSVAFHPDGQTLASGGHDNIVRLWDVSTGALRSVMAGHTAWISSVAFSPDGRTLASGSTDSTVLLWDVGAGTGLPWVAGDFRNLETNPDGHWEVWRNGSTVTANFRSPRAPVQYYARQDPQPQFVLPTGFRPVGQVTRTVRGTRGPRGPDAGGGQGSGHL